GGVGPRNLPEARTSCAGSVGTARSRPASMTSASRLFWLDRDYDQRNADTRTDSRYGNYLQAQRRLFDELDSTDPTTGFVVACGRIARPPIMSPPFVRADPRILSATLERSDWNGDPIADVELVAPRPAGLNNLRTAENRYYMDWPTGTGVNGRDLASRAYLL